MANHDTRAIAHFVILGHHQAALQQRYACKLLWGGLDAVRRGVQHGPFVVTQSDLYSCIHKLLIGESVVGFSGRGFLLSNLHHGFLGNLSDIVGEMRNFRTAADSTFCLKSRCLEVNEFLPIMIKHPLNVDDLACDLEEMSVAPQILPKLQAMVSDCNTNPDDIRDMIRLDAALSSMILKTANSAYYNPGYHIDTIDDAIMQLGFSDVYQILTMLAFSNMMASPLELYALSGGQFWRRSVACALAMERLARKYGEDPGVAYTIGLLHGIGMVFIEREVAGRDDKIVFNNSLPEDVAIAAEEMEVFGLNHAKVGAAVMRRWGFSDEIVVPVYNQFEPSEAGTHERMACLISFAKRMIGTIIDDGLGGAAMPGPDPLLIALLHLSKEEYQKVVLALRENFTKAQGLVGDVTPGKQKAKKVMESKLGYGQRRIRT